MCIKRLLFANGKSAMSGFLLVNSLVDQTQTNAETKNTKDDDKDADA